MPASPLIYPDTFVADSLIYGPFELAQPGNPYRLVEGDRGLGDPQAVTQAIQAQLTMGSFRTGSFTDNRSISLHIRISAKSRPELILLDSALRAQVNLQLNTLQWTPGGGFGGQIFDTFRGQCTTTWDNHAEGYFLRWIRVDMDALPFARSMTQRMLSGSVTSVQLGNFAQPTEYLYTTPDKTDTSPYGEDPTTVPTPLSGIVYGEQPSPAPVDGSGCMQLSLGGYTNTRAPGAILGITSTLAKIGPVTGTWDLSSNTNLTVGAAAMDPTPSIAIEIRLGDAHGAFQTFVVSGLIVSGLVWNYYTIDLSTATIDLTSIRSWTLWIGTRNWNVPPTSYYYLGMLRAYPTLSALAATANGAMFKLAGVLGDARAPASIEFDRIVGPPNLLTAADASFESGVGSWVGANATLSTTSSVAVDGTSSLQMLSIAGGVMYATSAKIPVAPLTEYTASLSCRAAVTPESATVITQWYDAANNPISSRTGDAVTDAVGSWVRPFVTGTSPATARSVTISLRYAATAVSELHDVDAVMLGAGTSTAFTGGTPLPSISGFLACRSPSWASIDTPVLMPVVAGHATTSAPSPLNGTYHLITVDASDIAGGAPMIVTQLNNGVPVDGGQVTLSSNVVAGGTRWGDFGDLTFPIVDIPAQAGNTTYDFQVTGTDVILCDTRGFLVWVPAMDPVNYVWVDEATAAGMGGVFGGTMPDRSDAASLLGLDGVQVSKAMSVDPGDNYLLVYCLDGAPVNVGVSYYDRYLGERTAA